MVEIQNVFDFEYVDAYKVEDVGCVSNASVFGLQGSIRGAKFPMSVDTRAISGELTPGIQKLAESEAGSGHDQWLTGVVVQFDLSFSVKAWTEAERYHFFDFVSSQSTMHRITKFDLDTAYNEYVDYRIVNIMKEKVEEYNRIDNLLQSEVVTEDPKLVEMLKQEKTEKYLEILYSNPAGFKLSARMTTNYRQLKTIYSQRKNHRLPEWRQFCEWIELLPMSNLITGKGKTNA